MASHPVNLTLRFLLELGVLFTAGAWGWAQSDTWLRFVWALGLPLALAVMWGTFAVPNDPSRSGHAPVPTPGGVRLFLELIFFALGTWWLVALGDLTAAWIFGGLVVVHYLTSYDRIKWLLTYR
jgi:hypothetical protein